MYLEHFGLHKPPFRITPDTNLFFEGYDRGATLHTLQFAINNGEGIIKVVGEVGTGKTMLCRMLANAEQDNINWVYLAHPNLSPDQTLKAIAKEMGLIVPKTDDKLAVMNKLHRRLLKQHNQGRHTVLLVEEAQAMPIETLEEIRLLSNLETDEFKLMQIVLFGQPELDEKLTLTHIRQLRERITLSIQLPPLDAQHVHQYLNFRLRAVGYKGPDLFTPSVAKKVFYYSKGLIRRINILADKIMLIAFTQTRHTLTVKDVKSALDDCEFKNQYKSSFLSWLNHYAAVFIFIIAIEISYAPNTYIDNSFLEHTHLNNINNQNTHAINTSIYPAYNHYEI